MRIAFFICAAFLAAGTIPAARQDPKKKADDKPVIVVTGCVEGSWLRVQQTDAVGSYRERYKLRGSKQMLKELASRYNRHRVEVTGAVTDTPDTVHRGKTIDVGKKTRIYTGAKEVPDVPVTSDPTLDVVSFRDLNGACR